MPERIRHRLPLPATSALYGLMLGLGFTTYLLTWAMWALLVACLLIGTPWLGLAVGVAFGIGRALPVLVLAGRFERPSTQQFILEMETGPLLRGLRRIDGVALIACALLIFPVATAGAARLPGSAADPSADDARHGIQPASRAGLRCGPTGTPRPAGKSTPRSAVASRLARRRRGHSCQCIQP